ncbi:nuclear autoantigenic sperm protein isoform X2 [Harpegnathos saltator]|uniref:Nuclear autoantigenic sperm protein n=2 Tax=Harpegnathos saltator TaxID=610380 RepID=E2C4L8_HARSA|nr:nuclear autoantigenic sperm protein isoform X2 [Harpegnathos saltator]XP_011150667.1 nuclear autoantigenic sperm protein isoform X2 [Harpegnathos saltator]XP_011150668.1 nuclear autoantigenic sperm protein isoform X2 [Harpegnathos saltator]XP_025161898.1 nuclear autoantigenic sperm protein isoform X2 [Harpegnathos saltator]EFN77098.1 Nuclear autoantigenic sperm protein [Harpegnathos saltator]
MADVSEDVLIKDAATAISQGKRHLLVRDYNLAVVVLAQACELLVREHGETGDEMGELYLLYGRALLGLAREEAGVLGGGVPGSEEASQDEDVQEEEEEEEDVEEETAEENNTSVLNDKGNDRKQEQLNGKNPENSTAEDEKTEKSSKTDNCQIEEQERSKKQKEEIPSCSRDYDLDGGKSNDGTNKTEDVSENVEKDNDEDDINNLQIAWEVLELAKLVLLKRGSSGWKYLAEAYRLLGEVAMEGGNHETALIDLQGCLDLLQKITPRDHRAIAEIHYQLGLAHAMANDFDASIEQFKQASALLEARIVHLQSMQDDPPSESCNDPFYTVQGEIKELKDLLPEIQDKIADIKDLKREADVIKEIKEDALNDAAESSDATGNGATFKPASDISHLVRKKRKAEDEADSAGIICKKSTAQREDA